MDATSLRETSPQISKRTEPRQTERYRQKRQIEEAATKLEANRLERFTAADLNSKDQRRGLAASHPMLEQRYYIETNDTAAFYEIVYDHILVRKSGLYVVGAYRVGKTTSVNKAIERLKKDVPWVATFCHSATRKANQSKKAFCEEMLSSFRYPWTTHAEPVSLVARFLMSLTVEAGSRTCVLFVDEAQMLTIVQLRYLLEIWNELRQEGFILVTVLVGQEGLVSLKTLTAEADHGAILARFFVNKYVLGGLHSLDDVQQYLAAYDNDLRYPNPDWPYTKFFCQQAFENDWRLANEAEHFWNALRDHSGAADRMLAYTGFRLAFVNDAIHAFLLDSMKSDRKSFQGSPANWREAVSLAAESDLFIGKDHGTH